jgi:hypothetical protein
MHEIFLFPRDLAAPFETSLLEQGDDTVVFIERSCYAGFPFISLQR